MATTILAVDDSVTMRKILEITFAGTDFAPVIVGTANEAIARLRSGGVGLVICDNSLPEDGYEVARQLKATAPGVPLLFLSSRQNPYDAGKGSGAQVDDHIDKPFDTTQLIDRANKLLSGGVGAQPAAAPAAAAAAPAAAKKAAGFGAAAPAAAPVAAAAPAAAQKSAGFGAGGLGAVKPAAAAAPAAARPAPAPSPAPAPVAARAAPAAAAAAATASNGPLAAKMGELGLTAAQADAVLALSRDLIERVVWEVVPVLAETLIKEEIARLAK